MVKPFAVVSGLSVHLGYFQGYLFISVLLSASSELMKLVIQSIKNDITSRNPVHVNLALHCIANIGSREMAEAFGKDIPKLLVSGSVRDNTSFELKLSADIDIELIFCQYKFS